MGMDHLSHEVKGQPSARLRVHPVTVQAFKKNE